MTLGNWIGCIGVVLGFIAIWAFIQHDKHKWRTLHTWHRWSCGTWAKMTMHRQVGGQPTRHMVVTVHADTEDEALADLDYIEAACKAMEATT